MPPTETISEKLRPEELDGPVIDAPDGYYSIRKSDGSVWIEPKDGESIRLADPENYPDEIIERLEERQRSLVTKNFAGELRAITERTAHYIRLKPNKTAEEIFHESCGPTIRDAAGRGQSSVQFRLVLREGAGKLVSPQQLDEFRQFVTGLGLGYTIGHDVHPKEGLPPRRYISLTISW